MNDAIKEIFERVGIKDYDDLSDVEKQTYFKMLEIAESSKITLEDVVKGVKKMRETVEFAIATDKLTHDQDLFLKARLKNYILLESIFERPERAREMLNQYGKVAKMK